MMNMDEVRDIIKSIIDTYEICADAEYPVRVPIDEEDIEALNTAIKMLKELEFLREHPMLALNIRDKWYIPDKPKVKTVHGKTGEVVIGGFKEVKR